MLKNLSALFMRKSNKMLKSKNFYFSADMLSDKEKAEEKEYMVRQDKAKMKKLKKKMMEKMMSESDYFDVDENINVEDILEDQEWLKVN
jgi:hypothetical protein